MVDVTKANGLSNRHITKDFKTVAAETEAISATQPPSEPNGPTGILVNWIFHLKLSDIPKDILDRAKYLMLDGLACGLVGAHVPWSEVAVNATKFIEPSEGTHVLIGYDRKVSALTSALLNGSFIQATELDDYHSLAPWHSMAVILPALLAAAQSSPEPVTGEDFLLALIVGLEVGPRVGNALDGAYLLTSGWHSGPVYGHPAAAAAVSKLWKLSPLQTEEAIGIASTQAGGLMSAQYGGMVKRMQHAFAARNGLFAAFMAKGNYRGIQQVFERPYGGLLAMFSKGNKKDPAYFPEKIHERLGELWLLETVRIKMYACVGAVHGMIELLSDLQTELPERFADVKKIKNMTVACRVQRFITMGGVPEERPLSTTGAQMCGPYIAATQLVDGEVLLAQFGASKLDRDDVWTLTKRSVVTMMSTLIALKAWGVGARIKIEFDDGEVIDRIKKQPRGFEPGITNNEIVDKYRRLTRALVPPNRAAGIESLVIGLEAVEDIRDISALLAGEVANPLA